jgi:hypothetical protein
VSRWLSRLLRLGPAHEVSTWLLEPDEERLVEQAGAEESEIMSGAPVEPMPCLALSAAGVAADATFRAQGLLRLTHALDGSTAEALASHINASLAAALEAVRRGEVESERFGGVLCRSHRYDLKLALEPPVGRAVEEVLRRGLRPLLQRLLGEGATLFELAALVSDPGAPCQLVHPDIAFDAATPMRPGEEEQQGRGQGPGWRQRQRQWERPGVVTAFVAVQEVAEDMGPTTFLPRTHTRAAHAAFEAELPPHAAMLCAQPRCVCLLRRGDLALFDARLLHCGGANTSPLRRTLFYFSFKAAHATPPHGTLLPGLGEKRLGESFLQREEACV